MKKTDVVTPGSRAPARDWVERAKSWRWPQNARVAITIGLAFEGFDRYSQFRTETQPQKVNHFSLSYADYGWKAGAWRLLELLDRFNVKSQVYTSGKAAEAHPDVVLALAQAGHEIVGHGWVNDSQFGDDDPSEEQNYIRRCTEVLQDAAKSRPVGWVSPAYSLSKHTLGILKSEGYVWCGDDASDDLPFITQTEHGELVMMPVTGYAANDLGMWIAPRNPPGVIWEGFKDTFDCLYEEGSAGAPKWTEIVLHCHIAGRPTLIPTVRRCLEYAQKHEGVWIAPRRELADWTLKLERDSR
jgi:peptidoglycan/xylan/chitin deacetylase (PgdA/CDA1 family)